MCVLTFGMITFARSCRRHGQK